MSLKFKDLRKSIGISKKDLAADAHVDIRTITNWEKIDGTIPTLQMASEIAKVLHVSTYEVFKCFTDDPDKEKEDFRFNQHDLTKNFTSERNYIPALFHFFQAQKWYGSGIMRYRSSIFRFSNILFCNSDDEDPIKRYGIAPFSGMILIDESLNMIPIQTEDLVTWKKEDDSFENYTARLEFRHPLMEAMETEYNENGSCTAYITIWKYHEEHPCLFDLESYAPRRMEQSDVIPTYIKEIRHRKNLTQDAFAQRLFFTNGKNVDKWEHGVYMPRLNQLAFICDICHVSAEALLDAYDNYYYASHAADEEVHCFNVGINYLFSKIHGDDDFHTFADAFKFLRDTFFSFEGTEGTVMKAPYAYLTTVSEDATSSYGYPISDIQIFSDRTDVTYANGKTESFNRKDLMIRFPGRNLQNYFYEFELSYNSRAGTKQYTLGFSLFLLFLLLNDKNSGTRSH